MCVWGGGGGGGGGGAGGGGAGGSLTSRYFWGIERIGVRSNLLLN